MHSMQTEKTRIDFHIHSSYSDGILSPKALVGMARKRGVAAIAVTDHDTMAGTPEAIDEGNKQGVEVIPGVEISALLNDISMHILGYGLNYEESGLQEGLAVLQKARHDRNLGILEKLNKLGIAIDFAELRRSTVGQIGRPHIARLLVKKRVVKSVHQAFLLYLKKNRPAFVDSYILPAAEAIRMIREAGGLAFLAHPASIDPTLASLPALLRALKDMGLAGLELHHPNHSAKTRKILRKMGEDTGLLFSGGSDFHGDISKEKPLGGGSKFDHVPYEFWQEMQHTLAAHKTHKCSSSKALS